jgi:hypothetical protein
MIHAHALDRVRWDELSGAGGVVVVTFVRRCVDLSRVEAGVFRIGNRSGDHVATTGPFSQINEAASVAAERKIGVATQDDGFASRTTKTANFFAWHDEVDAEVIFKRTLLERLKITELRNY